MKYSFATTVLKKNSFFNSEQKLSDVLAVKTFPSSNGTLLTVQINSEKNRTQFFGLLKQAKNLSTEEFKITITEVPPLTVNIEGTNPLILHLLQLAIFINDQKKALILPKSFYASIFENLNQHLSIIPQAFTC
ncbi:MAG: hypothetical protein JSR33_10200 [Proteobacteria bacterium]|nr:hypothetical protein [Pseudomonadota bacterium]